MHKIHQNIIINQLSTIYKEIKIIKKLIEYKITKRDGDYINADNNTQIINTLVCKINELVDAVNKLDALLGLTNTALQELKKVKAPDPYTEQRKWIGKLCWFWNKNDKHCGILTSVFDNNKYGEDSQTEEYPFQRDSIGCWQHCEPVKLDDDMIYKGGKDE